MMLAGKRATLAVIAVTVGFGASSAQASDFLSALFGALPTPAPQSSLPYADERYVPDPQPAPGHFRRARTHGGGSNARQAFCVRPCDGRYFPIAASNGQSRAAACSSLCPAGKARVFYGSSIDGAASDSGKPYSHLVNAFRYRSEIVPGCTCNGKDQFGLAKINVRNDPTIRKGDLVAGKNGLMVAGKIDRHGEPPNFSPASAEVRARFQRLPIVASQ